MSEQPQIGDWGPAPPGVDLNENQDGEILRPVIALMTLGILAVGARLVARFKAHAGIAIDDYLILASLVGHAPRSPSNATTRLTGR